MRKKLWMRGETKFEMQGGEVGEWMASRGGKIWEEV